MSEEKGFGFLSKTEKKYFDALAAHPTIKEAAQALGVKPRTLYNWLFNLRKRYRKRRGWVNAVINQKRRSPLLAKILSERKPLEEIVESEEWEQ